MFSVFFSQTPAQNDGRRRNLSDPEKGASIDAAQNLDPKTTLSFSLDQDQINDDDEQIFSDDDDNVGLDDDLDENQIIHDVDLGNEEDIETPSHSKRGRVLKKFSTVTSLGSFVHRGNLSWIRRLFDPSESQEEEGFIPNYRFTPILSGIVIPFSILLEIPGLTGRWYIRTENNKTVEVRKNPVLLDLGMGVSMACGLLASICLVSRFLEKRVKLMTVLCIFFLTVHDIINILVVTIFGVEHRAEDGFTYGQSFWMTVCSTAVSSFTNVTLLWDFIRTPNFSQSGSGLTRKQRSLVIIVIMLLTYIALGAFAQTYTLHLNFIDALYFTVVAIETIGFGDIQPRTTGSRIFLAPYVAIGIVTLALAVGMTRETVLEGLEVGYRKRVHQVRQKRKQQRRKRRVEMRWREAIEYQLRAIGAPIWVKDDPGDFQKPRGLLGRSIDKLWPSGENRQYGHGHTLWIGHGYGTHPHRMHLNLEALSAPQLHSAALEAGVALENLLPPGYKRVVRKPSETDLGGSGSRAFEPPEDSSLPLTHRRLGHMAVMLVRFAHAMHDTASDSREIDMNSDGSFSAEDFHSRSYPNSSSTNLAKSARPRRSLGQQYDNLKAGMEDEERRAFYARLTVVWIFFLIFWATGSLIFKATEGWTFGDAMYFCFIAFTTIGFGDYAPATPAGRSVFVVWAFLGVPTMTILFSVLSEAFSYRYKKSLHTSLFKRAVKRYRAYALQVGEKATCNFHRAHNHRHTLRHSASEPDFASHHEEDHSSTHEKAKKHLEDLPGLILHGAKTFHEHIKYFQHHRRKARTASGEIDDVKIPLPEGIKTLLEEIAGAERMSQKIKDEILADDNARYMLFTLSVEKALQGMVQAAEKAVEALHERNQLDALRHRASRSEIDIVLPKSKSRSPSFSGRSSPRPASITGILFAEPESTMRDSDPLPAAALVREHSPLPSIYREREPSSPVPAAILRGASPPPRRSSPAPPRGSSPTPRGRGSTSTPTPSIFREYGSSSAQTGITEVLRDHPRTATPSLKQTDEKH